MADKRSAKTGTEGEEEPAAEEPSSSLADLVESAEAPPAEARARLAEDRLSEVLAAYRKLKAENETFRERTSRNLERRFEQRHERLLLKFIDIMDNLDRALEAAQTNFASTPLVEGLILVRTQLLQMLKEEGLERIPVLGLPFDPHVSEAVAMEPVAESEHHNVVVKELQRGWRLKDRIARPSRVVLGEYAGAAAEAAAGPEHPQKPAALAPAAEPSLEDIIAQAQADEPAPAQETSPAESLLDGLLEEIPELEELEEVPPEDEE